ncbi:hypothetical protein [Bacillus sp. JJ722]|uniref:hypothetical protein n=1 Tax=Bacillus sp. JJ722 TaxID=3122973 RepID=UPI002FFF2F4C
MRFLKVFVVIVIVLVGIGYGVYYFGTNMASVKVMDAVSEELENSGQIDAVKKEIEKDPDLQKMVNEGANVDESKLPFKTKEEATRVIIKKVGISELNDIKNQVQNGTASKEEIMNKVQDKLTDEEILALKVIAYKELNK